MPRMALNTLTGNAAMKKSSIRSCAMNTSVPWSR